MNNVEKFKKIAEELIEQYDKENAAYGEGKQRAMNMKRLLINILWITTAIPFYILVSASCIYSMFLHVIYKPIKEKVEPYSWIDALDTWFYELKNKWL